MTYKGRLWIAGISIVLICWIDHQVFSEGLRARALPVMARQLGHIAILSITTAIGYWGWKTHPHSWTKRLWLFIYITFIIALLSIGFVNLQAQIFSKGFLDIISSIRYAFCSPLPFIIIYVLTKLNKE